MPSPLNPGDLFPNSIVKLFEELERWVLAIRQHCPELLKIEYGLKTNPLIDAEDRELPQLRELLSRQYLRIGFLGGSQAGKSRTLNNFIGRKVVPVGEMRSCTSTRIRLRTTQGPGRIVLRYMTYESYRQRRDDVGADLLNLYDRESSHTIADERVLELLDDAKAKNLFGEGDLDVADFLSRILRSGGRFPEVLAKKGHKAFTETLDQTFENFEELEEVLAKIAKHPEDADVRKESLLEEIDVCHREIPIPARLELLDMPGLNTTQGQDEAYTLRAAAELDGALIAMNLASNLKDPGTYKLTTLLSKRFPDLAQRIWIVATKVDTVPRDLLHGKPGNNLIDSLGKELRRHKIGSDRVMLISNEYRDEVCSRGAKIGDFRTLKLDANPDGTPSFPDAIAADRDFHHAFECLAEDGGFGRLTRTVNNGVADAVLADVNSDVRRRMSNVLSSIEKLLRDAEYVSSMGKSGRALARSWRKEFDKLLDRAIGPDDALIEVGRMLLSSLIKELDDSTNSVPLNADSDRIVQLVKNLQEDLTECGGAIFGQTGPVFSYLNSVADKVEELTKKLAKPQMVDPVAELRTRLEVIDAKWLDRLRSDVQSFSSPLLVGRDGKTSLARQDVIELFKAKIQQVCRQTLYRIESLVRWHLQEVSHMLGRLNQEESDNQASADDYRRLLGELQTFKDRLTSIQDTGNNTIIASAQTAVTDKPSTDQVVKSLQVDSREIEPVVRESTTSNSNTTFSQSSAVQSSPIDDSSNAPEEW